MKILYSQIKELVPGLKAQDGSEDKKVHEICDAFTLIGHMVDGFEKIKYQGKDDYLISLEIRQNRADCLSVIGIAYEVAAYFRLSVELLKVETKEAEGKIDIKVNTGETIKRIRALEITGAKNAESPAWLQELLKFHDINPINLLVDLSNYVMIYTGYPSHLLDKDKIKGTLFWSINDKFEQITTLDGSKIKLGKDEIILEDDKNILALAGIVGGNVAEIDLNSNHIIAEMAIYDRAKVRKNARDLVISTEASTRLEKDLDPNGIDYAMNMLCGLIEEYCPSAKIEKEFSYYPQPRKSPEIKLRPSSPSRFAGIEITPEQSVKILRDLRFEVEKSDERYIVTPPTDRMDVELEEDVVEEILRIYGFDKIPTDQVPTLEVVKDITPAIINLDEKIRDVLSAKSYDEVLSWPLTNKSVNEKVNYVNWQMITTQNSVNDEFPDLRMSIATGLVNQLDQYRKKNVEFIDIFEIGKVFGKIDGKYAERESLGVLSCKNKKDLNGFKKVIEGTLRTAGLDSVSYKKSAKVPENANPHSCWDIVADEQNIGIIYKFRSTDPKEHIYFAEINLGKALDLIKISDVKSVFELKEKIITLDANVELLRQNPKVSSRSGGSKTPPSGVEINKDESIENYLAKIKQKIDPKHLWNIRIVDKFAIDGAMRYTVRASYLELSDQQAKKLHLETFGLS